MFATMAAILATFGGAITLAFVLVNTAFRGEDG
jgi:hypothetical protein